MVLALECSNKVHIFIHSIVKTKDANSGNDHSLNSPPQPSLSWPSSGGSQHHTAQGEPLLTLGENMPTEPIQPSPERSVLPGGGKAPAHLGEEGGGGGEENQEGTGLLLHSVNICRASALLELQYEGDLGRPCRQTGEPNGQVLCGARLKEVQRAVWA